MLNKQYLPMLDQLKEYFSQNGQISLQEIFSTEVDMRSGLEFKTNKVLMSHKYEEAASTPLITETLNDGLFLQFLQEVTGKKIPLVQGVIKRFSHGSYELRRSCKPGILLVIDIGDSLEGVGGEYGFATEEETAIIPAIANSLSIIHVDENTEAFCTYITHHAGEASRIVIEVMLEEA